MKIGSSLLKTYLCLLTVQALWSLSALAAEDLGHVTGRIECHKTSDCSGIAVLWKKEPGVVPDPRRFTLPPAVVVPLQADGSFELEAPPGDYYVGAFLRKSSGPLMGPPRAGDLIYLTPDPAGEALEVTLAAGKTAATGNHREAWSFQGMTDPAETGISGQILDVNSQPVAGLLVFAFADADLSSSPQGVSTRSDTDGRFILPLPKPGSIYLRARKTYQGGQPQPGDYVGVFGGGAPKALSVSEGQRIGNIRIQVLKIPDQMKKRNASGTSRPKIHN